MLLLDNVQVDPLAQMLTVTRTIISPGQVYSFTEVSRFCFPSEIDLSMMLAGFEFVGRYASWSADPADQRSRSHISEYIRRP